ncbi:hypothetical protein G7046_g9106 [Stylonectria norvegica]|nr:hypothetical protein G7046_g9106 [Stylonectria norvegica]
MQSREDIVAWLFQTEPTPQSPHSHLQQVVSQHHPISPPATEPSRKKRRCMVSTMVPTPKRQKTAHPRVAQEDDSEDDAHPTPKASQQWNGTSNGQPILATTPKVPMNQLQTLSQGNLTRSSSARSGSQSNQSGRTSPIKGFRNLELAPDGLETRVISLNHPLLPKELLGILSELDACLSNGEGVISLLQKDAIQAKAKSDPEFQGIPDFAYADSVVRDQLGPTPTVAFVEWILNESRDCQESRQSEAGWNMAVHFPLLHRALYGFVRTQQLVGFAQCTTAKIVKEYFPTERKMIDFCIYVDPKSSDADVGSETAFQAVETLCRVLPCGTINHTDFFALRNRPIAISIETKRKSGQQESAELQIGTWHTAQWKLLAQLVSRSGGSLDELPFLPGIIINGNDWVFVATTREGTKTVLWLEKMFGMTSSVQGVYRLFWGLQRLALWAEEVYWPWFLKNALGSNSRHGLLDE